MFFTSAIISFKDRQNLLFFIPNYYFKSLVTVRVPSDLGDAEFGVPGRVKPGPDANNSLPRIPTDS